VLLVGGSSNWHPNGSRSEVGSFADGGPSASRSRPASSSAGPLVGALPAHWLDPAGQQVLRRLVAQAVICERREVRLRELRAQGQDGSEEADALAAAHSATAKTVAYLLTQLRATPRSRVVSRDAGPKVEETPQARPWEIQARG
jgi:hypothetical protein